MKFLLLITIFLSSCSGVDMYKNSRKFSHLEDRVAVKQSSARKTPPSELSQVGYRPQKKYYLSGTSYNQKKSSYINQANQNYLQERDLDETFINEDGSYSGIYKVGNPYKIFGIKYYPQEYDQFQETGISSWYGDAFHGKKTANGETYHKGEMTAAHRTLPMPSMILVTNLANGRSLKLRVSDRGPFAKNRIVDVSETAAIKLGFKDKGTANVKLELLKDETEELLLRLGLK
jgi:rare lipoprotein A (peptidoglycan hydrolase)